METKALVFRTWDDLVFAYRNKSYGAYMIRKAYSNRVILGFAVSKAMVVFIILGTMLSRSENFTATIPVDKRGDFVFHDYIPPVKPQPPAPRTQAAKRVNRNTTIQVVSTAVDPPVEMPASVSSSPGTDTGTGEPVEGVSSGTGTAIVDVAVPAEPEIRTIAEVMPVYEGGMEAIIKFVKKHLRYPASARRQGIDGTVFVSFVVAGDGSVKMVSILRGIHVDCDEEAVRVISMLPKWRGGMHNGNPVSVKMVLPIKFSLQ